MRNTIPLAVFNSIVDGDDGTLDVMGYELPAHGYFVGGNGSPLVFESREAANTPGALRSMVEFVKNTPARFVGWWADSGTGKVYIDGSDWFASLDEARRIALERGEIAFWDMAGNREIRTSGE